MKEIVVIYQSETGFTKRYATWIAEELNCSIYNRKEVDASILEKYDIIIYGSWFHAGQIRGLKKMKTLVSNIQGKDLIVFATGAMPPDAQHIVKEAMKQNFTQAEQKKIPAFYFWGGLNYEKMGWKSKWMMKVFCKLMEKKKNKTEEEVAMSKVISHSFDKSKKEYITPLVTYINEIN